MKGNSMISIENLCYSVPQKDLYHNISFTIEEGQHCALIGSSGAGKSTLLDLIMHTEDYLYDGKITRSSECRIGYVSQFSASEKAKQITVFDFLAEPFVQIQEEMDAICREMEDATELDALLERYQLVLDRFDAIGGNEYESTITKNLNLAHLTRHEHLLLSQLSGGEYKLIQVIKEMLLQPNLLIMDEPDVYLDFERLDSLKDLINSYKGSVLVATHNRYLLNHCFNKILHLEQTELQEFEGRYIDYNFALLQKKIELQEQAAKEAEEIERNQKIVEKMRSEATYYTCASRGRALHARVSHLERLEARKIKEPFVEIKQPHIQFHTDLTPGKDPILNVIDYDVAFDDSILEHVNFTMNATDKVALIGPNGTGKTTLLRDIFKHANPSIQIADGTQVAFLSQLQGEMLNENHTIVDEFLDAGFASVTQIEEHLSSYGFEGDVLNQTIRTLSGGEKNLLQLAKLSQSSANLLLLDEPTSHLDTYAQLALEQAINDYNGAILMVSHDFYTIANCVDYVLLIEDRSIRKISIRKFRKMMYANHFDKNYLMNEQSKKELETKIAYALKDKNFELAKSLSESLEACLRLL